MEPINKQRMRVVTITRQPRNYSALVLVTIAALVAVIIVSLFLPRSAHGETALQPVAYLPLMQSNLQKYPVTVEPISAMTQTPPTATPQPELGEPPFVPAEVQ